MQVMVRHCLSIFLPVLTACASGGAIAVPRPSLLEPSTVDSAKAWVGTLRPPEFRTDSLKWEVTSNREGTGGGSGRVILAAYDSARLDLKAPLGRRSSAVVIGDRLEWGEPRKEVDKFVPSFPLFWAMLGIARPPEPGATVHRYRDAKMVIWQYADGSDTIKYVRYSAPDLRLIAEVRSGRQLIGTVETRFGPDGLPASSKLIVPKEAKVDITFTKHDRTTEIAPDIWNPPAGP